MRSVNIFSPTLKSKNSSGITIRIDQIKNLLEANDFIVKIKYLQKEDPESNNFNYVMISTKQDSISTKIASFSKNNRLIVDLYTPLLLEKETYLSKWKPRDWLIRQNQKKVVNKIISAGTYFLVANRRQKEYWLKTAKKLKCPIKRSNIFVLPTGVPKMLDFKQPISHFAGSKPTSNVILWFGAVYPWMDPLPLLNAFSKIIVKNHSWKLRILGAFHPDTGYQSIYDKVVKDAKKLIPRAALDIVPWQSAKNLSYHLNDIAFGVHLPKETPEDYYSHRVRLLTILEAGIPIITTGSDVISNMVGKNRAGIKTTKKELRTILQEIISKPGIIKNWSKNTHKIQKSFIKSQEEFYKFKKVLEKNER